jgi:hypothetical protein
MPSLGTSLKYADKLAQDVIDAWNAAPANLTPEFGALVHVTFLYKTARHRAENHRAFDILSGSDEAKERATRSMFVRAYKIFRQRRAARFN